MARDTRSKAKASSQQGGFIECELDEAGRAACREWIKTPEDLLSWLQQLLDDKYTIKVAYEPRNECYAAYISGHWTLNTPDAKWTLSGRGSTASNAMRQVLYKHFVELGGDWTIHKTGVSREKNWD